MEPGVRRGTGSLSGKGYFWEVIILRHAQTYLQSIFSVLFVSGQQRCSLWPPFGNSSAVDSCLHVVFRTAVQFSSVDCSCAVSRL